MKIVYHITRLLYNKDVVKRKKLAAAHAFTFKGVTLGYDVEGEGKPLVLLHGSMIVDPWNGCSKELAKNFKIYLPHLPGFGSSDAVNGELHNTDLFAEAFYEFLKWMHLENAPVIAMSLGAVVALKSAEMGYPKGELILIGMPVAVESQKLKYSSLLPVPLRRLLCSTEWGRKMVLLPVLRDIIGSTSDDQDEELLDSLVATDTRSLVDINVEKEVGQMPSLLEKVTNKIVFIYGRKDKLLEKSGEYVEDPIVIAGSYHNIFKWQPKITVEVLEKLLR